MVSFSRSGTIVDIVNRRQFPGTIYVEQGKIARIVADESPKTTDYILPGFIDAHIHIESSMVIPSEFARLATVHGTVATVSDPHEIGNVLGIEGIRYMIQNGRQVPFHFYFGAPSCVPATQFETAGACITAEDIESLFKQDDLKYLSEMMNFPGVLHRDPEVMKKIEVARQLGKPVDGHAPGLRGKDAEQYISAGISTDHECFTFDEALDKIKFGMHILIREGSAAKNYEALHPLIKQFPEKVMFCSDDKHPHELVKGHINELVKRSIVEKKYDLMDVLRVASYNPVVHYKLDVGLLRLQDSADFIIVDNLHDFTVLETFLKGERVAAKGQALIPSVRASTPNHFQASEKKPSDFIYMATGKEIRVIQPEDGQLITHSAVLAAKIVDNQVMPDLERDILKLTVVNRYEEAETKPAVAFIQNFGLKRGAIASCIAHDSHNIIAVGCSDEEICAAVNLLIQYKGGIAAVNGTDQRVLPLPVAGIMTNEDGYVAADKYSAIDSFAKSLGTQLTAPFMTLSFMALLVIPELKLSDKGLFDGKSFSFVSHGG
jgi:adenine deaminase